ncbi:MAG: MFS transporter [Hyphomicrobiales bacterium]|nr:MAG: MFS transporter [Hyphomicrobiales bacterium]
MVEERRKNRRVAGASLIGTLIEGYDLIIYGTAAALVFPEIFFPALGSAAGTLASLATFAVAFIARPFGSILFGHFGDRLGRKRTLVTTLMLMGVSTVVVGLIPPASMIGIAAPVLLIACRIVQGVSQGGEWAGATLFVAEHVPANRRGFFAMFPQLGAVLPLPLSSITFLVIGLTLSDEAFVSWGWRIPFLASGLLIVVGLWLRLTVDETPVFKAEQARTMTTSVPFLEAFKRQPLVIVLGSGVALTAFSLVYISSTYLTNYATTTLDMDRTTVLLSGLAGGVVYCVSTAFAAALSDRIGRVRMLMAGHIAAAAWALMLFPIVNGQSFSHLTLAMCISFFIAGLVYGPIGAYLPELFKTKYRYTATGFTYNISGVIGGGLIPILAPVLIETYSTVAFGLLLSGVCVVAAICTIRLGENRNRDLREI